MAEISNGTVARDANYTPYIFGDALEGEARDVGKVFAGIATQVTSRAQPIAAPCALLSGGETTVTVRGNGRGGRNVEFLLALAIALEGNPHVHALAGDTDGVDGLEEIAGAYMGPDTLARAWAKGLRPKDRLADNDGHGFFEARGDSVITGPTLTNVNDFRAILIEAPDAEGRSGPPGSARPGQTDRCPETRYATDAPERGAAPNWGLVLG